MGRGKLAATLVVLLAAGCGGKRAQLCPTCDTADLVALLAAVALLWRRRR